MERKDERYGTARSARRTLWFQIIRNTVNCNTGNPKTKPNCSKHFRMSRKNCLKGSAPQKSSWTEYPSAKPLLPDSKSPCGWRQKRSMKRTTSKRVTAEITHRSAVFLYTLIAWFRLKNGKIYGIKNIDKSGFTSIQTYKLLTTKLLYGII